MKTEKKEVKMKLKKGDLVQVIAGKDKGKQGKITEVVRDDNRVIVEGVNLVKRHKKATQQNPEGGIMMKNLSIHASNVMLLDPKSGKPTRVKLVMKNNQTIRVAKSGAEIPAPAGK
jgi:large subunit ribosomal protein L24